MIEKMFKVYCVARARDRDALLEAIRGLGVVHLEPVDPAKAVVDEDTAAACDRLDRALQVIGDVKPAGTAPDLAGDAAVEEVLAVDRRAGERQTRLTALYRQLRELEMWGDTQVADLRRLEDVGLKPTFWVLPTADVGMIEADCVQVVGAASGDRSVVAVVKRGGAATLSENAEEVPLPKTDRPAIRVEAAEIDAALKQDRERIAELAHLKPQLVVERAQARERAAFSKAVGGALSADDLFAVQGWVPVVRSEQLAPGLEAAGLDAAVQLMEPAEDESPPTLLTYPAWTKPIKGLFEILGTVPGYRELDVSSFFMLAMPLFAGILIGDAGYGAIFMLLGGIFYKKLVAAAGPAKIQLLLVIGLVTFIWGMITGNIFGLNPSDWPEPIGKILNGIAFVGGEQSTLMAIAFIIAVIHLVSARLVAALGMWPDQRALAEVGWAAFLGGIFGVVWFLFFPPETGGLSPIIPVLLLVGYVLAVLFSAPSPNPVKRLGLGVASCLLPAMNTFSDTMSYIRLMAVSMASFYIAQSFNSLAATMAESATWIAGGLIVLFGHTLNIGLCLIAVFAHGVRLNMLEFSNNAGVQWAGHSFEPFAKSTIKES